MPWKFRISAFLLTPVLILSFQNCSDFSLQEEVLYGQALLESQQALDAELLPQLLNATELRRWYKSSNNNYVNQATSGDQWSMIVAVERTATGKILYMNSAADTEEGSITISGGKIQATRYNNVGTAYSEVLEADLPSSGQYMVIAASFGASAGDISLLVNGRVQQTSVVSTGTPGDHTSATKTLNTSGSLLEYVVFVGDSASSATSGNLSTAQLNVMSRYLADNLGIPDVIFDPVLAGGGGTTVDNTRFLAAKAILDSKCLSCHNGAQSPNLSNLTETSAVNQGMVVKGSPTTSMLYYRLIGSSGGGVKNMPQGGSISASEVQTIADWITNIQ